MKCPHCKKNNLNKANYCQKCDYKFTDEEKKNVKENIIVTILNKVSDFKDLITGDLFKNNNFVRVGSIILVLAIGLYMVLTMGYKLSILNNDDYEVKYNEELNTYYILLKKKSNNDEVVQVDTVFYVPNRINKLDLTYFDEKNTVISEKTYEKQKYYPLLVNNKANNYYILSNHDNSEEQLKIYVYYGE